MIDGRLDGHNGQFSHSLVHCVDTMDAVLRCGHKEQLTLNQQVQEKDLVTLHRIVSSPGASSDGLSKALVRHVSISCDKM